MVELRGIFLLPLLLVCQAIGLNANYRLAMVNRPASADIKLTTMDETLYAHSVYLSSTPLEPLLAKSASTTEIHGTNQIRVAHVFRNVYSSTIKVILAWVYAGVLVPFSQVPYDARDVQRIAEWIGGLEALTRALQQERQLHSISQPAANPQAAPQYKRPLFSWPESTRTPLDLETRNRKFIEAVGSGHLSTAARMYGITESECRHVFDRIVQTTPGSEQWFLHAARHGQLHLARLLYAAAPHACARVLPMLSSTHFAGWLAAGGVQRGVEVWRGVCLYARNVAWIGGARMDDAGLMVLAVYRRMQRLGVLPLGVGLSREEYVREVGPFLRYGVVDAVLRRVLEATLWRDEADLLGLES